MKFRKEIDESPTLKFAEAARNRRDEGKEIISLGLGEPDFDVPNKIIEATIEALKQNKAGYSSPLGLHEFRELLAKKFKNVNNIPAKKNNILVTPGAKQALQLSLMALLEPNDEVIVINPSYVSFIPQIYIAEPKAIVKVVDVDKDDFSLPIDKIESGLSEKTKVLILNTPNNPAGYTVPNKQLRYLYELAEKHNFFIISDEVYEKLIFPDEIHLSIGSFEHKVERVFTINGYSKSHAMTGWRIGYLSFPDSFFQKLLKLQQHINTNTCTFIQQGLIKAFDMDLGYLESYNNKLAKRAELVYNKIQEIEGLSLNKPTAGFFSFINISELEIDSNTFCGGLIDETGVATTPGLAFGENWDDHFRLSYAVDDEILIKGLDLIEMFVKEL